MSNKGAQINSDYADESEERILNDDYKNWKKSVPFLYDAVMTHALHWPSFTLEWLPSDIRDGKIQKSRLLLGAKTDNDKSHLLLADVYLPSESDLDTNIPFGTYKTGLGKVDIQRRIPHIGAVTKARHMPQQCDLVASTSSNGDITVYDFSNNRYVVTDSDRDDLGDIPEPSSSCPPLMKLSGNCMGDSSDSLCWSHSHAGFLLTADSDHSVSLYDTNVSRDPCARFSAHSSAVNDVSWWRHLPTVFLSCSADGDICLWDVRSRCKSRASHVIKGHKAAVSSVAPSLYSRHLFVSGSEDGTVALWDVRYLSAKLHSLGGGGEAGGGVRQVQWSPHSANILASSHGNRTVTLWDLDSLHCDSARQRQQQRGGSSPLDCPELLFVHGGHSSTVTDFHWHPSAKNTIASTASDNIVQIWRPMDNFMNETNIDTAAPPSITSTTNVNNNNTVNNQQ